MKAIIITSLLGLCSIFALAQKNTVTGTVNSDKGVPVPYAFIKDAIKNYGTYTDSFGNFTLKVDKVDRIIVTAANFKSTVVSVSDPQKVLVTLTPDGTTSTIKIDPETFAEKLSNEGMTKNVASGYIAHENTLHGSRYLFDHWMHGYIIATDDSIQQSNNNLYNYDKMAGSLVVTTDGKKMQNANRDAIKRFVLVDEQGTYVFEDVPAIDKKEYIQVLSAGPKYKIYKKLGTKFFPNDYVSNGMTSTGHNYDEIKDVPEYYVVAGTGAPKELVLKNKALKVMFAADLPVVNKYISAHDGDIDDNYLKDLGDTLNQ